MFIKIKTKIKDYFPIIKEKIKNFIFGFGAYWGSWWIILILLLIYSIWWFTILYYKLAIDIWSNRVESLEIQLIEWNKRLKELRKKQNCLVSQFNRIAKTKKVKIWYCRNIVSK